MRNADERRCDAALLLTLWARSVEAPREDAGDQLWQMKLAFLTALGLSRDEVRALTLNFYRWTWGPLSNEVYEAWDDLEGAGSMCPEERFVFTRRGLELAEAFYAEVVCDERNVIVRETLDRVAAEWRGEPRTGDLLRHVSTIEIVPLANGAFAAVPIQAVAAGDPLLEPVPADRAKGGLTVEPGWRETLPLAMNPESRATLDAAIADFREGRISVG